MASKRKAIFMKINSKFSQKKIKPPLQTLFNKVRIMLIATAMIVIAFNTNIASSHENNSVDIIGQPSYRSGNSELLNNIPVPHNFATLQSISSYTVTPTHYTNWANWLDSGNWGWRNNGIYESVYNWAYFDQRESIARSFTTGREGSKTYLAIPTTTSVNGLNGYGYVFTLVYDCSGHQCGEPIFAISISDSGEVDSFSYDRAFNRWNVVNNSDYKIFVNEGIEGERAELTVKHVYNSLEDLNSRNNVVDINSIVLSRPPFSQLGMNSSMVIYDTETARLDFSRIRPSEYKEPHYGNQIFRSHSWGRENSGSYEYAIKHLSGNITQGIPEHFLAIAPLKDGSSAVVKVRFERQNSHELFLEVESLLTGAIEQHYKYQSDDAARFLYENISDVTLEKLRSEILPNNYLDSPSFYGLDLQPSTIQVGNLSIMIQAYEEAQTNAKLKGNYYGAQKVQQTINELKDTRYSLRLSEVQNEAISFAIGVIGDAISAALAKPRVISGETVIPIDSSDHAYNHGPKFHQFRSGRPLPEFGGLPEAQDLEHNPIINRQGRKVAVGFVDGKYQLITRKSDHTIVIYDPRSIEGGYENVVKSGPNSFMRIGLKGGGGSNGQEPHVVPGGGLQKHEDHQGHLIARHVKKTLSELRGRLNNQPYLTAASTFTDLDIAEKSVAKAISSKSQSINNFLRRKEYRHIVYYDYGSPVGMVVKRGSLSPIYTTKLQVVLEYCANSPVGYRIVTGYPTL